MIRPKAFRAAGIDVLHDELGHTGTLQWSDLTLDATTLTLTVPCPVGGCNSVSYWPVGGGGDALAGQRMFIHKLKRAQGGRTWAQALALVKAAVQAREGADRWKLDDASEDT